MERASKHSTPRALPPVDRDGTGLSSHPSAVWVLRVERITQEQVLRSTDEVENVAHTIERSVTHYTQLVD